MARERPGAALAAMLALSVRRLLGHRLHSLLAVAAVAIGTSLFLSSAILTTSLSTSVARAIEAFGGTDVIEITGPAGTGVPRTVADEVTALPGVGVAAPVVREPIEVAGIEALLIGIDARAATLTPDLRAAPDTAGSGEPRPVRPGEVAVSRRLAEDHGIAPGTTLAFTVGGRARRAAVGAVVAVGDTVNEGLAVVAALGDAQRVVGHLEADRVTSVLVRPAPGADLGDVERQLGERLGPSLVILRTDERIASATQAFAGLQQALTTMAVLALVVGGFLVFNTLTMVGAARRRELAIMRALGGRRRRLLAGFLLDAGLIGAAGALAGIALGVASASAVLGSVPEGLTVTLGVPLRLAFTPVTPAAAAGVAIAVSVAAAGRPAWRAVHVPPAEAMQAGALDEAGDGAHRRPARLDAAVAGAIVAAAGAALALARPDQPLAATVLLIGGPLLALGGLAGPLAGACARMLRRAGSAGALAAAAVERSPGRLWSTTSTVLLTVAMVTSIGGATANIRASAARILAPMGEIDVIAATTPPDLVPTRTIVPPPVIDAVRAIPGIASVSRGQFTFVHHGGRRVLVQGWDDGRGALLDRLATPEARQLVAEGRGAIISSQIAQRHDLTVGDPFDLPTSEGPRRLQVAGVVDSFSWPDGHVGIRLADLERWYHRSGATYVAVDVRDGADPAAVADEMRDATAGGGTAVFVYTGRASMEAGLAAIGQVESLLLAVAAVVVVCAGLAVLNTSLISVLGRRRELGVLRAIGARRRLVRRSVEGEAAALAALGAAGGLPFGVALHRLLVQILNLASGYPARFELAAAPLGIAVAASVVTAVAGATVPARRAARTDMITAIGYE